MVFLRIKKVKGHEYAYVVENSWHAESRLGSRQKVKKYIGRVYRFNTKKDDDFFSCLGISNIEEYIKNNENKKIVNDLIKWEFFKYGIDWDEFTINWDTPEIKNKNKGVCIKINDGFLCSATLKNLLEFKAKVNEGVNELSFRLGRAFVEAGIAIPEDVFIGLFEKIKGKGDLSAFKGFYY